MSKIFLLVLLGIVAAKEITRSKRQMNVYYMCGTYPYTYVSQYPCNNGGNGCGYSNCNGLSTVGILPTSFYSPYNNCNNGCSNLNCNQYNGMYINGQYVAYNYGSNQYSSCASSCCNNYNYFNNNNGFNNGYNPYPMIAPGPVIGNGVLPGYTIGNGISGGNGVNNLAVNVCGGTEASNGICNQGYCSSGFVCVQGNNCCRCQIGASNGQCSNGVGCGAGYSCMPNGYCCATSPWQGGSGLQQCVDNSCPADFNCGTGNLCYPIGK